MNYPLVFWPAFLLVMAYLWARSRPNTSPPPSTSNTPQLKAINKTKVTNARTGNEYAWGRYTQPITNPNVEAQSLVGNPLKEFRLKHWHYVSVTTPNHIVVAAIVQLGYLANVFCYVFTPSRTDKPLREFRALLPLGSGVSMANSSCEGTSVWRSGSNRIELTTNEGKFEVKVDITSKDISLKGEFELEQPKKSLGLLYPLIATNVPRAAYTHKAVGMRAKGKLLCDEELIDLNGGLGCLDWTKSFAKRETKWKWINFSSRVKDDEGIVRDVGVNLSAEVYEDTENVIFVDESMYTTSGITVTKVNPKLYRVATVDGSVDLTFTALDAKIESVNAIIIKDSFVQATGFYSGTIKVEKKDKKVNLVVEKSLGVLEEHYALW